MTAQPSRIRIETVDVLDGYAVRLGFSDGTSRDVDLEAELWGPVFEPLLDPQLFRRVAVDPELGTIVWPNGADIDPDVLHGDQTPECSRPTAPAAASRGRSPGSSAPAG